MGRGDGEKLCNVVMGGRGLSSAQGFWHRDVMERGVSESSKKVLCNL